jgi:hypothetical protein
MIYTHVCNKPGLNIRSPIDEWTTEPQVVIDEKIFVYHEPLSSNSR